MKMLRGYVVIVVIILMVLFGILVVALFGQEQPKLPAKMEEPKLKAWKLPTYMQENLQWMLDDFNKRFDAKVQAYKQELKTRFEEFKDMPDDVVLYLEGGIFITRSDFQKLQEQLRDKLKEQTKKEVKGDDKTTN